jgi:hypothetical protein
MTPPKHWLQTASGKAFDLREPTPEMVDVIDVAIGLSNIARYNGQVPFFSVAEHSVRCSFAPEATTTRLQFLALLHDAHEAYVGDVTAPLKQAMRATASYLSDGYTDASHYDSCEEEAESAVAKAFAAHPLVEEQPIIRTIDMRMCATEALLLHMQPPPHPWTIGYEPYEKLPGRPLSSPAGSRASRRKPSSSATPR